MLWNTMLIVKKIKCKMLTMLHSAGQPLDLVEIFLNTHMSSIHYTVL